LLARRKERIANIAYNNEDDHEVPETGCWVSLIDTAESRPRSPGVLGCSANADQLRDPVWNPVSIGRLVGGDGSPSSSVVQVSDGQVFIPVSELDPLSRPAQESVGAARSSHSTDSVCATHRGPRESLRTGSNLLSVVQPFIFTATSLAVWPCGRAVDFVSRRLRRPSAALRNSCRLVAWRRSRAADVLLLRLSPDLGRSCAGLCSGRV